MKLYDYYRSSSCYRVRIALNIKQLSYDKIPVHLLNHGGEQHLPAYHAINPQELVPSLDLLNGQILTQSLAIIEYLDELQPQPALLPKTALGRAMVRRLAYMIACDIHPLNNLRVLQQLRQEFSATEEQVVLWYHRWLKAGFDAMETTLQSLPRATSVCYGDTITLADLCLIPQVYNAQRYQFPLTNYPLIMAINNHCLTIPAFIKASPDE